MAQSTLDTLPGFRRRFIVTPRPNWVRSEVEDDYHCMSVTIRHENGIAAGVDAVLVRAPWTTCPGAEARLSQTFAGVALSEFASRGEKNANCTHLHDLALLAAAHFADDAPLTYDILVSDPVEGRRGVELRRNGTTVLDWVDMAGRIVEPAELAGLELMKMRQWIESLDPERQEFARLLRWGALIANGRTIPMERQSDARRMPVGNCYTFQPETVINARRIGEIRDFSAGQAHPLDKRELFDRQRSEPAR